ncbi:MAG: hypothetical protein PHU46_13715 [Rhodocyclaceae bacterium]|nr:hypothetical protein [Rhodocyclaceae bacterium]
MILFLDFDEVLRSADERMYLQSATTREYLLTHKQSGANVKTFEQSGATVQPGDVQKILHDQMRGNVRLQP